MRVALPCDHGGFGLKEDIAAGAPADTTSSIRRQDLVTTGRLSDFVIPLAEAWRRGRWSAGWRFAAAASGRGLRQQGAGRPRLHDRRSFSAAGVEDDHMNVLCLADACGTRGRVGPRRRPPRGGIQQPSATCALGRSASFEARAASSSSLPGGLDRRRFQCRRESTGSCPWASRTCSRRRRRYRRRSFVGYLRPAALAVPRPAPSAFRADLR